MFRIQTLNKISTKGLNKLPRDNYEIASELKDPDAILVRSASMHSLEVQDTVKAVARAGAGTNNIPIDKLSDKGIVVFNTPGANANSVKELVLTGMLLSSRRVFDAMAWVKTIKDTGDEIPKTIEANKSKFAGPLLAGKKMGVIGLGAIGVKVANAAASLGMEVTGFDPFLSVDAAWGLSRSIKKAVSMDSLIASSDYISLHVPLTESTKGIINKDKLSLMKEGTRLLNFARGGLVNNKDIAVAISEGKIAAYVTDFPDEEVLNMDGVLAIPHLGASTPEAEENCAIMATKQLKKFLEQGTIKNSVNFPDCNLESSGKYRIIIANKNIPNMVGQITTSLANEGINITDMINKHRGDYAYNIIDIENPAADTVIEKIKAINGVIMVRAINL